MSGTTLILDSDAIADVAVTNGFFPPVPDGLAGYYEMDPALISDGKLPNLVNPALPALIVGSPVLEADGFTFEGLVSYLNTQLPETQYMTMAAVAKPVVASGVALPSAVIAGNFGTPGSMLFTQAPTGGQTVGSLRTSAYVDNGAGGSTSAQAAITEPAGALNWMSLWGRVGAGTRDVANMTTGQQGSFASTAARILNAANPIRVGSSTSASYAGKVKIARFALWTRAVIDTERGTMHAFWQGDVGDLGITV
ncbi:hypothetical protein HMPREF9946_02243 [Acetobacteraceae bacterium AT-5844]|nr:hypothetical protein HMPREF9946_02243 [Acetobacteraceae bacterium AT-5844]